jgi:hypothetical protein
MKNAADAGCHFTEASLVPLLVETDGVGFFKACQFPGRLHVAVHHIAFQLQRQVCANDVFADVCETSSFP